MVKHPAMLVLKRQYHVCAHEQTCTHTACTYNLYMHAKVHICVLYLYLYAVMLHSACFKGTKIVIGPNM